ncbi:MAG: ABC transporter permease subunit [Clostridia bacterium]
MLAKNQTCLSSDKPSLLKQISQNRCVYLFIFISLAWYIVFCYGPMYGLTLAFKDFNARKGILHSDFVGMKHYIDLFSNKDFFIALGNTLVISLQRIIFEFPVPIIIALLLNELRPGRYKKTLQTVFTFPYFLSWVVVGSIALNLLGSDGIINNLIALSGGDKQQFLANKAFFRPLLYISSIWKSAGWTSIIYLAAMSSISPELYEAAMIDGANKFQRMLHITLPCIRSTIVVMLLLAVGNTMNAGFDQIFNMYNPTVLSVADILDTYIYRITFQISGDFGFSTAVGLFKSIVNFTLLFLFDRVAKLLGETGLF